MNLEAQFADYAAHHANSFNKACHYLGLPLIGLCLFGLGSRVSFLELGAWLAVDLGSLLAVALLAVYFSWRPRLALGVALLFAPLYIVGGQLSTPELLGWLAVGVGLQYVGHYVFEKRSPAFHHNLIHTLVGPLWIAASFFELLKSFGRPGSWFRR